MAKFGGDQQLLRRARVIKDVSWASTDILKLTDYVPHQNTEVPDDISILTDPLIENFTNAMSGSPIGHTDLRYADITREKKVASLNFNLLMIYSDPNCYCRHTKENPSENSFKIVKTKI